MFQEVSKSKLETTLDCQSVERDSISQLIRKKLRINVKPINIRDENIWVKIQRRFLNIVFELKSSRFIKVIADEQGDVPGWVLVVLMTTGLVTAIWTIAAPRLSEILKHSLDSMNSIG